MAAGSQKAEGGKKRETESGGNRTGEAVNGSEEMKEGAESNSEKPGDEADPDVKKPESKVRDEKPAADE